MTEKKSSLIATQDEVLETLTAILRREKKEVIVLSKKIRRSYYDDRNKKVIEEREEPLFVEVDTKISDVNRAADLLGRRYGLYTDKVSVDGSVETNMGQLASLLEGRKKRRDGVHR